MLQPGCCVPCAFQKVKNHGPRLMPAALPERKAVADTSGLSLGLPMDAIPQWRHAGNLSSDSSERGPDLLSHDSTFRPSVELLHSASPCPHQCCKWTTWPFKSVLSLKFTITFYKGVCPGFDSLTQTYLPNSADVVRYQSPQPSEWLGRPGFFRRGRHPTTVYFVLPLPRGEKRWEVLV